MVRAAVIAFAVGVVFASTVQADVYKYTDEKGNVQYTDRPKVLPAQRINIQSARTDVVDVEYRSQEAAKAAAQQNKQQQSTQKTQADKKQAEEITETKKAEECAKAREDYRVRTTNWRLYEDNNGERRYLSAQEIDAARDSAKKAMDELCK